MRKLAVFGKKKIVLLVFGMICMCIGPSVVFAQNVVARAAVSARDIYFGEELVFQIQVEGSDSPDLPDTSHITDFNVTFEAGRANNSHSISIVNGQRSEVVRKGYLFNYQLVPIAAGDLIIPSVTVVNDGVSYRTEAVRIRVRKPAETDDYKLRQFLSKQNSYAGEPVVLTVVWYWNPERPATSLTNFSVPVLSSDDFRIIETDADPPTGVKLMQLPIQGENTIVIQSERILDGRKYTTLEFERVLVPKKTGAVEIPMATVVFEGVTGYEQYRDFFGRAARREVTGKFVVPSNTPDLEVKKLPSAGQPPSFSGLVGEYHIDAIASHTAVNVGDPVTLTIRVSGSGYLGEFDLPRLSEISDMARDFKIPDSRSTGRSEGETRVFTQTIRPKHADVEFIPTLELSYFNPATERYVTSRSDPIGIEVKETRIVTIQDVEGDEPVDVKTELETFNEGIAYNYEGLDVIVDRPLGLEVFTSQPSRMAALAVAPLIYIALFFALRHGRNRIDAVEEREARGALRRFIHAVEALPSDGNAVSGEGAAGVDQSAVLELLKAFIGKRLKRPAGSLTYADIVSDPAFETVDPDIVDALRLVFEECEAGHYGGIGSESVATLSTRAVEIARAIDEALR